MPDPVIHVACDGQLPSGARCSQVVRGNHRFLASLENAYGAIICGDCEDNQYYANITRADIEDSRREQQWEFATNR